MFAVTFWRRQERRERGSHLANFVYAARSHVMQEVVMVCPDAADGRTDRCSNRAESLLAAAQDSFKSNPL